MATIYPLLIHPRLLEKIWGGQYLACALGKPAPADEKIGESWEVYDENTVTNGIYTGMTIAQLRAEMGSDLMGVLPADQPFPLLTKLIDAHEALSVQVHPDDAAARRLEGQPNGKTECWYVIHAEPGAELTYGFSRDTGPEEYERLTDEGKLEEVLSSLPVQAGDVVYIPAGTVHAIGAGIVVYEVQQTSDVTYRIYDWNRVDEHGHARELHVEKAKGVLDYHRWTREPVRPLTSVARGISFLVAGEYFTLELVDAAVSRPLSTHGSPAVICALDQPVVIISGPADEAVTVPPYSSALVPAAAERYRLEPEGGNPSPVRALVAAVPESRAGTIEELRRCGFDAEAIDGFLAQFAPAQDLGQGKTRIDS